MNCHQCKNAFDEHTFVPRLLIVCGHSFCDNCLSRIHSGGKIVCPECRTSNFVECIASLPRNLALLAPKQQQTSLICSSHSKKFQAFCDKEKMLLCINCVLDDTHRNHNHMIESIASAYEKQKQKLDDQTSHFGKMYARIQEQINKLEDSYQLGLKCYEDNQIAIERQFNEVRKLVQAEQDYLLQKAKDLFLNFQTKNKQKESICLNNLDVLDELSQEITKSERLSPEEFLQRTTVRDSLTQKLCENYEGTLSFSGLTISKNSVIEALVKTLEKNKTKELKESNTKQTVKADLSKAKILSQKTRKAPLIKQNPSIKYAPSKKYSKKETKEKQPIKQAVAVREKEIHVPPLLVKRPQTSLQKPIPQDISGFDENHTLFKSFLSSNASFFLERRYVYVLGGFCQQSNSIIRFNLDTSKWEHVSTMANRAKFGVAQIGRELIVLGGKRDKLRVSSGESYRDNQLVSSWGLNDARSGFGTAVFNEDLFVVGGNSGEELLNTFERYSQYEGVWKKLDSMNERRDQLAVTVGRDSRIYAIGGFGGSQNTCLRSVERYDPITRKWQFAKPMQVPRRALSAVTLADGIYAIGGFDGQNYLRSVQKYDQYSNTWTLVAEMKEARCTHSAVAIFETQEILVFGGFDISPLSSVQKYSVVSGKWQLAAQMPAPRFMHGCLYVKQ